MKGNTNMNPTPTTFILSSLIKMRNVTLRPLVMIINNIHICIGIILVTMYLPQLLFTTQTQCRLNLNSLVFGIALGLRKNVLLEEDPGLLT